MRRRRRRVRHDDRGDRRRRATSPAGSRRTARAPSARSRPRPPSASSSENPDVQVTVGVSGTGGGFERFCAGETDLSNASRPIKEDEEAQTARTTAIEYVEFQVANDALTVVVNTDNDWVDVPDRRAARRRSGARTRRSRTGTRSTRPSRTRSSSLFGPGTDSGTFDYFTDEINGEEGASRSDYSASEDDNVTVRGVAGEKGGLGYFGFSYYEENQDTLKALEVDGGDGCVAPSVETAQDGTYTPLSRPLFVYAKTGVARAARGPGVRRYILDNAIEIAEAAQFVPLTDEQLTKAQSDLEAALGLVVGDAGADCGRGATAPRPAPAVRRGRRQGRPRPLRAVSVVTTVGIVVALLVPALEFFREVPIVDFLTGTDWAPLFEPAHFGVLPLIVGHALVTCSPASSRCRSASARRST